MGISAVLLIFSIHEDSGLSMMRMHEQFPNDFQWISMYTNRASKRRSQVTKESNRFCLVDLLCRNTDFNLLKVKHQNGEYGNFEFIQNVKKGHLPLSDSSILRNIGSMRELYSGFTPTMINNMPEW